LTIDVAPGELPSILKLVHDEVVEGTKKHCPWMLPLQVEFEFGLSWGDRFKIKEFRIKDSNILESSTEFERTKRGVFDKLLASLKRAYRVTCDCANGETNKYTCHLSLESIEAEAALDIVDGKLGERLQADRHCKDGYLADMSSHLAGVASIRQNDMELVLCKYCVEPMITVGCHAMCECCSFRYSCGD